MPEKQLSVLAMSYLMTLYVFFPIHLNFPTRRGVFQKFLFMEKKQWIVLRLLEKVFSFSKRCCLYVIVRAYGI